MDERPRNELAALLWIAAALLAVLELAWWWSMLVYS
jgi:hypothetical protein